MPNPEERPVDLRTELARRMRPACADFSEREFEELLDDMVRVRHKYEQLASLGWTRGPSSSRRDPPDASSGRSA